MNKETIIAMLKELRDEYKGGVYTKEDWLERAYETIEDILRSTGNLE